ncbi:phage major capsid protein [Amycolatopsis methanolica]|uniref:phage major capsid protein n=1 Tax=Amycolatopsis methanolica TaxID=1814 RepID=UPI0034443376
MAFTTTTAGAGGLLPEDFGDLLWQPTRDRSVALQVATVHQTRYKEMHFPVVTALPSASWVAEMGTIPESDPDVETVIATPKKIAQITPVSLEMIRDSDPAALTLVATSLAAALANGVDAAVFAAATATNGPTALGAVAATVVDANGYTNLDPFIEAQAEAASRGTRITAFVADPATYTLVRTLKTGTGSNAYLMDVSANGVSIGGTPLLQSQNVPAGTVYGIPQDHFHAVVSTENEVSVSEHTKFAQYAVDVRAVIRVDFAYTYPEAIVKIAEVA